MKFRVLMFFLVFATDFVSLLQFSLFVGFYYRETVKHKQIIETTNSILPENRTLNGTKNKHQKSESQAAQATKILELKLQRMSKKTHQNTWSVFFFTICFALIHIQLITMIQLNLALL